MIIKDKRYCKIFNITLQVLLNIFLVEIIVISIENSFYRLCLSSPVSSITRVGVRSCGRIL